MNALTLGEAEAARGGLSPVRIPPREMFNILSDEKVRPGSVFPLVDDLKRDGRIFLLNDYTVDELCDDCARELFLRGELSGPFAHWAFLICYSSPETEEVPVNLFVTVTHSGGDCSFTAAQNVRFRDGSTASTLRCKAEFWRDNDSGQLYCENALHRPGIDEANVDHFVQLVLFVMFQITDSRVPVERITPDAKLNAARAKRGKPPIPAYWKVGAPYVTELSPGRTAAPTKNGSGTHASPVPHSRRAHPRRLPSGRIIWIRDCKVGEIVKHLTRKREFYAVITNGGV